MNKKLLLFFLLALVVLVGKITIKNVESSEKENTYNYTHADTHLIAYSSPFYIKTDVRATMIEKVAYNSNLEGTFKDTCPFYNLLAQYDWNVDDACKIMFCESSGNAEAYNFNHRTKDNSVGLFQINLYGNLANERPSLEELKIPKINIATAYNIYLKEGRRFGTTGGWHNCAKRENVW